jgi:beta-lactamase regulating signal transducer with metallopeptidase domain
MLWGINIVTGRKAGYYWRKVFWLVMSVYLLISIPVDMGAVTKSLTGLNVDIQLDMPQVFQSNSVKNVNSANVTMNDNKALNNTNAVKTINLSEYSENRSVKEEKADTNEIKQESVAQSTDNVVPSVITTNTTDENERAQSISLLVLIPLIIAIAWTATIVTLLIIRLIQYKRLGKKYKDISFAPTDSELINEFSKICSELNIKKEIGIRIISKESGITSPMLFGYRKTMLLLPDISYTTEELDVIFRHELTHYQAGDLWYKLLIVLTCDIYWFNPIFRLMKQMAFQDVEFVCDERVTKYMDNNKKKTYCNTILKTMSGRNKDIAFSAGFAVTKKKAKERFENIFSAHNRKASIALLLVCVTTLTISTGCVSVKVSQNESDTNKTEETAAENKDIVIDSEVTALNEDAYSTWVKENKDFNFKKTTGNYYELSDEEKQNTDCFAAWNNNISELVQQGTVRDITSVLEKRGWLSKMNDASKATISDADGKVYGVPVSMYGWGLLINKDLFEEAGLVKNGEITVPSTWEEIGTMSQQIKEKTGKAGICISTEDIIGALDYYIIAKSYGAEIESIDENGKYSQSIDNKEAIDAMKLFKDLKWKYNALTDRPGEENYETMYEKVVNGSVAMSIVGSDSLKNATDLANFVFVPTPAGPTGMQYTVFCGEYIVFSKDATDQEVETVLSLVEKMGYGPDFSDDTEMRIKNSIEDTENPLSGPEIPIWNNEALYNYEQEQLQSKYGLEYEQYEAFMEKAIEPGNLISEVKKGASGFYVGIQEIMSSIEKK